MFEPLASVPLGHYLHVSDKALPWAYNWAVPTTPPPYTHPPPYTPPLGIIIWNIYMDVKVTNSSNVSKHTNCTHMTTAIQNYIWKMLRKVDISKGIAKRILHVGFIKGTREQVFYHKYFTSMIGLLLSHSLVYLIAYKIIIKFARFYWCSQKRNQGNRLALFLREVYQYFPF